MKFVFFLALISTQVLANCEFERNHDVLEVRYISRLGNLNCSTIQQFINELDNVSELTPYRPQFRLFVQREYSNASFDHGNILQIPQRFYFDRGHGIGHSDHFGHSQQPNSMFQNYHTPGRAYLNVSELINIAVHEYGHLIFNEYIRENIVGKNHIFTMMDKLSEIKSLLLSRSTNEEDARVLQNEKSEILNNEEFEHFITLLSPYHELYADVLTVYRMNNPSTMANTLFVSGYGNDMDLGARLRDFSNRINAPENALYGSHSMFYYVRQFIGVNIWSSSRENHPHNLHQIALILLEDIKQKVDLPINDRREILPSQRNTDIITLLQNGVNDGRFIIHN